MKFGRLKNVDGVDFSMPDSSSALLGWEPEEAKDFELYVGAPVWAHKSFVGKIYPPKTKPGEYLALYARSFNCIELNSTFYGIPESSRIERWRDQVGPDFRFCPKAPRSISHEASFTLRQDLAALFRSLEFFGQNLGAVFFQFPPDVGPRQWKRLEAILELIPDGFEIAVELRNSEWFASRKALEWLLELGQTKRIMFVISDTAGRRDVLHYCLPVPRAFVRFAGDALVASDFGRLDVWIQTLREFRGRGLRSCYFFLHQEIEGHCVELAEYFRDKMPEAHLPQVERARVQEQLALF